MLHVRLEYPSPLCFFSQSSASNIKRKYEICSSSPAWPSACFSNEKYAATDAFLGKTNAEKHEHRPPIEQPWLVIAATKAETNT